MGFLCTASEYGVHMQIAYESENMEMKFHKDGTLDVLSVT